MGRSLPAASKAGWGQVHYLGALRAQAPVLRREEPHKEAGGSGHWLQCLRQVPPLSWSSVASQRPWGDEMTGSGRGAQNMDSETGPPGLESWMRCLQAM